MNPFCKILQMKKQGRCRSHRELLQSIQTIKVVCIAQHQNSLPLSCASQYISQSFSRRQQVPSISLSWLCQRLHLMASFIYTTHFDHFYYLYVFFCKVSISFIKFSLACSLVPAGMLQMKHLLYENSERLLFLAEVVWVIVAHIFAPVMAIQFKCKSAPDVVSTMRLWMCFLAMLSQTF